jgi:hypothetical protein
MAGSATISWVTCMNDADAELFITATGITDPTVISAINNLVISLKSNNLWAKMNAIYPFVGGTSTTCKYNLKDPRDLDAAFRLTFSGTPSFASTGVTFNGSNSADTHLAPSSVLSLNNTHMSLYSRTSTSSGGSGVYDTANNAVLVIYRRYPDDLFYAGVNQSAEESVVANTNGSGFYVASRTASNSLVFSKNSTVYNSSTVSNSLSAFSLKIGENGADFDAAEYAFFSIGTSVNSSEATSFYTIVQSFQSALGRNV